MRLPDLQCRVCLSVCHDRTRRTQPGAWRPCKRLLEVELSYCPKCREKAREEQAMDGGGAGRDKP